MCLKDVAHWFIAYSHFLGVSNFNTLHTSTIVWMTSKPYSRLPSGSERLSLILSLYISAHQINQPPKVYYVEESKNVHYATKFTVFEKLSFSGLPTFPTKISETFSDNILEDWRKTICRQGDFNLPTLHTVWNSPISKFYIRPTFFLVTWPMYPKTFNCVSLTRKRKGNLHERNKLVKCVCKSNLP